jgi:alkanesulfonate monooxygenase
VAQLVIQHTTRLMPLVALQPIYLHPYSAAKMVATIGHLYGRRVALNLVAGGFKNDLDALGDSTPHDRRYDRLVEYASLVQQLLHGGHVTFEGDFYGVRTLTLSPALPAGLFPAFLMSGSSPAGLAAARQLGATAIRYPEPPDQLPAAGVSPTVAESGIRIGIIARPDDDEAWRIAHRRFPEDRKGQLTHHLAMKVSDSSWHHQLAALGRRPHDPQNGYWLVPFQNYKTFCPYLVGSYARVAAELQRYIAAGNRTFILDIPPDAAELAHTSMAFAAAREGVPA